jgi:4-amino-4-deoxy-L-arabinose transferase-like glycosyltransferase
LLESTDRRFGGSGSLPPFTVNRLIVGQWAPWILVAVVLLMLVPGTASLPLVDRDEPRFARATDEMVERADWIKPTFNGQDRFDKPVLTYWLMRAGYALCGQGEFGARLHSIVSALLLVLLTWHTGRRWFDARAGFLAALGLATCVQMFLHGRLALADMPMVACVALVMVALGELLLAPEPGQARTNLRFWWWALYLGLGVGFLAKGPIVLAVPVVGLALMRWALWRKPLPWSRLKPFRGLLVTLAIMASWGVPALLVTQGRFFSVGVGEHVVQRGYDRFNNRGYTPFFYLGTAPLSLFPWIGLAGLAYFAARRKWSARNAWITSWMAAPYCIFTAYATQLPHYVLPAFPAFFLLLGQGLGMPERMRGARRLGRVFAGAMAVIAAAGIVVLAVITPPAGTEAMRFAFLGALFAVLGLTLLPFAVLGERVWLGVAGMLAVAGGSLALGHYARQVHPAVHFAADWRALSADTRLVGYDFSEPSLVFYSGRSWIFPSDEEQLAAEIAKPGPMVVVTVVKECDPVLLLLGRERWRDKEQPAGLGSWTHEDYAGLNFGRTRWQVLRVSRRE